MKASIKTVCVVASLVFGCGFIIHTVYARATEYDNVGVATQRQLNGRGYKGRIAQEANGPIEIQESNSVMSENRRYDCPYGDCNGENCWHEDCPYYEERQQGQGGGQGVGSGVRRHAQDGTGNGHHRNCR